jgi:hypothetical protein
MKFKSTEKRRGKIFVFLNLLTMLIILLDILFEIYHRTCFLVYGIEWVKRDEYIQVMDRNKLQYLNFFEKLGCMYCGYVNGVLLYLKEIASRTEDYWCGIMHASKPGFKTQEHQVRQDFAEFADENDFKAKFE